MTEWLTFLGAYLVTLVDTWLLVAGGLLTLNEISGKFTGRSWEWPREHRLAVVVVILLCAQLGAYKNLRDQSSRDAVSLKTELDAARRRVEPPVVAENPDHASLTADVARLLRENADLTKQNLTFANELVQARSEVRSTASALTSAQSQVADLQQQLNRAKQAPTVVLGSGATISRDACDALGNFVEQGRRLIIETRKEQTPHPGPEADKWAAAVESFLRKTFGEGSIGLFRSSSGLPLGLTAVQSEVHRNIEGNIQTRVARLQQFAQKCF